MTKDTFRHLFKGNPMLAEVQRERKRALAEHNWKGGQLAARVLIAVFYFFFIVLTLNYIDAVEPFVIMYIMLALVTIVVPANLHGAIAGERESRALDMLLVAPVTPAQIIVGKYAKAVLMVGLIAVFIGVPAFFIELVKQNDSQYRYGSDSNGVVGYFISLLLIVATAMMIGALTMWVSTKTKTKTGAMLATIGALFVYFLVLPMIGGAMSFLWPSMSELIINSNPYVLLYHAYVGLPDYYNYGYSYEPTTVHASAYVWPAIVGLVLLAGMFLTLAVANLQKIALGRTE